VTFDVQFGKAVWGITPAILTFFIFAEKENWF
jgi:hypothetical protein